MTAIWHFGSAACCGTAFLGFSTAARGWRSAGSDGKGQLALLPLPGTRALAIECSGASSQQAASGARMPPSMLASWCVRQLLTAEAAQPTLWGCVLGVHLKNRWWWQPLPNLIMPEDPHPTRAGTGIVRTTLEVSWQEADGPYAPLLPETRRHG